MAADRFGSAFCYVEGTTERISEYRFSHEQHCIDFLKGLPAVTRVSALCRIGIHKMKRRSVVDGGSRKLTWGYCERCNKYRTEGWAEDLNTFSNGATP